MQVVTDEIEIESSLVGIGRIKLGSSPYSPIRMELEALQDDLPESFVVPIRIPFVRPDVSGKLVETVLLNVVKKFSNRIVPSIVRLSPVDDD